MAGTLVGMLFAEMKKKLDAQHIPMAIMAVDAQPSAKSSLPYYTFLQKSLEPLNIPMATTSRKLNNDKWYLKNDVHLNAKGHARVATIMQSFLREWIDKAKENKAGRQQEP